MMSGQFRTLAMLWNNHDMLAICLFDENAGHSGISVIQFTRLWMMHKLLDLAGNTIINADIVKLLNKIYQKSL